MMFPQVKQLPKNGQLCQVHSTKYAVGAFPLTHYSLLLGSVGEWLFKAACPSEIANFKRFIACLERFERESGMKIQLTPGGFTQTLVYLLIYLLIIIYNIGNFKVPLGPDLQASIKFNMG